MIPNAEPRTQVGTLGGEKIAMQFDQSSLVHLMGLLTNLYSDQELACLREYSTNAWDAHVEAGVDRPIEVTLPNALDMTLRIRDFGRGLSLDSLVNVYALYGASTKRDSNDYNGMMGIGGKSALTYTNQFTIMSRHEGRKIGVSISMRTDGTPEMEIVFDAPSDEPSGVEIIIPARNSNGFAIKADRFFRFWQKGRVLLNGVEPSVVEGVWINESQCVVRTDRYNNTGDVIVMGNVPYPLNIPLGGTVYGREYYTVTYVPNGAVNFTPSREELMYTDLTKATIAKYDNRFRQDMRAALQNELQSKTKAEALTFMEQWSNYSLTYMGHARPTGARAISGFRFHATNSFNEVLRPHYMNVETEAKREDGITIIYGFEPERFTKIHKQKVHAYLDGRDMSKQCYIMPLKPTLDAESLFWLKINYIDWELIKKVKIARPAPTAKTVEFEVHSLESNGYAKHLKVDEIKGNVLYYMHADERSGTGSNLRVTYLSRMLPANTPMVRVTKANLSVLLKAHPKAVHYKAYLKDQFTTWKNSLTKDQYQALALMSSAEGNFYGLDPDKVADPRLAKLIRLRKSAVGIKKDIEDKRTRFSNQFNYAGYLGMSANFSVDLSQHQEILDLDGILSACYPLVNEYYKEASYEYIEMIYNKENKND